MLIIKKIENQKDFELAAASDPLVSSRIFLLNSEAGKNSFYPMTPLAKADTKLLFGLLPRPNATIWEGGYYVRNFSFEINFEGSFKNISAPRNLQTSLRFRINGIDMEKDVTQLVGLLHNGALYEEDLKRELESAGDSFFKTLSAKLYEEETPRQAIFDLAADALARFFPALKTELLFADLEEELTPAEKKLKEDMEELNVKRQNMEMQLKERQSRSHLAISLMEVEENEANVKNAVALRDLERQISIRDNAFQLRMMDETAAEKIKLEKLKIQLESRLTANEAATAAKEKEYLDVRQKWLEEQQKEESCEMKRREDIHKKQMAKTEAEIKQYQLENEELENRIAALENAPDEALFQSWSSGDISNPAIREQEKEVRILNEDLLNSVAGVKKQALLDMLQEKYRTGKGVELKKDLIPVKIAARGISLEESFDDSAVRKGDQMRLAFTSPIRGYLTLICFSISGEITLLSPNVIDGSVIIDSGVEYTIPGGQFLPRHNLVQKGGAAGRERIAAIVTPEPLADLPAGLRGLADMDESQLPALISRLEALPGESWAAGYMGYTVI